MASISAFPKLLRQSDSTKRSPPIAADNGSERELLQICAEMASSKPGNVLPLEGEIDLHVSPRVERALASIIKKRPAHIVVDLSGVTFIDSSGLAALINAMQDVTKYGGKLTLSGIRSDVRAIFEIARLDQIFVIDPHNGEFVAD
jgi:anti-sigma B factor antagonist